MTNNNLIKFRANITLINLKQRQQVERDLGTFPHRNAAINAVEEFKKHQLGEGWELANYRLTPAEMSQEIFTFFNKVQEREKLPKLKNRNIPLEFEDN
ncbi:hypothetical protein C3007_10995 [Avibacterium gallinarum]|uniref:Uncharacterized protein n=1 Tax=Avibacterium gallinarum TaxID=755 RepID=A0A379AYD1_AVIGA|nr:hypothetical protein [Avibacterium gallinarum]POY43321.1 hypothetical protein C3007_10995 [Avibacterium gallinarum]TDP27415.1 hypothetical protein EV689_11218 [Avibacterium gallinarum]SUB27335.1 Uncharacterised protein [Avibacterium gallinarum]